LEGKCDSQGLGCQHHPHYCLYSVLAAAGMRISLSGMTALFLANDVSQLYSDDNANQIISDHGLKYLTYLTDDPYSSIISWPCTATILIDRSSDPWSSQA